MHSLTPMTFSTIATTTLHSLTLLLTQPTTQAATLLTPLASFTTPVVCQTILPSSSAITATGVAGPDDQDKNFTPANTPTVVSLFTAVTPSTDTNESSMDNAS